MGDAKDEMVCRPCDRHAVDGDGCIACWTEELGREIEDN